MADHGLGRIYRPDERDANFPMRAITKPGSVPVRRSWRLSTILDQSTSPMCVGYAGRQWLTMSPVRYREPQPDAPALYHGAQQNDEFPGENYDGTSARGLMKYLQSLGLVSSYHWAQTVEEMVQFVLTSGPVLVGMTWRQDMFAPDRQGFVHPTGAVVGGHEIVCYGYSQQTRVLTLVNSWGRAWNPAFPGRFRMRRDEFEALMADQGDMVAAVEANVV